MSHRSEKKSSQTIAGPRTDAEEGSLLKITSLVCAGTDGGAGSPGPEARETETTSVPWTGGPLEYLQGDSEAPALLVNMILLPNMRG